MRLITRYLLQEWFGPFLFALLTLGAMMSTGFVLFGLIEESAQYHFTFALMTQILLLRLPEMLFYTLPMAMLLSSLLAVARLANDQELLALRLMGLSFWSFSLPFLSLAIVMSSLTIALNEYIVPPSAWMARKILTEARSGHLTWPENREHLLLRDSGPEGLNHLIYAKQTYKNRLEGVVIHIFHQNEFRAILRSEKAFIHNGKWYFEQGELIELPSNVQRISRLRFQTYSMPLPAYLLDFISESRQPLEMNWRELNLYINQLEQAGQAVQSLKVRQHQKISTPMAALLFSGLGCILGARTLRSRSQGFGLSLILIFTYYLLMSIGTAWGDSGRVNALIGAWLPHLILSPCIIGLMVWRNRYA